MQGHFTDSFWSSDYAGGLGKMFQKLNQGVTENQQILTIATMRADAEELYSERLGDIAPSVDRMTGGFSRDDGASVRKVCIVAADKVVSILMLCRDRRMKVSEAKWLKRREAIRRLRQTSGSW